MNISKFTQKSVQAVQIWRRLLTNTAIRKLNRNICYNTLLTQEDSLILKLIEKMEINKDYFY